MMILRNTLYILQPHYFLGCKGRTIEVRDGDTLVRKLPIHNFGSIVCFNYTGVSPGLLRLCAEEDVTVTYLTPYGHYIGTWETDAKSSVHTRKLQYARQADPASPLAFAKRFVQAKIRNTKVLLQRYARDGTTAVEDFSGVIEKCDAAWRRVEEAVDAAEIIGYEGDLARAYFRIFPQLVHVDDPAIFMEGRTRHPPLDPVNALLSFGYGLLRVRMESALRTAGLDVQLGFLHTDRSGRASLALDMLEEFRAPYVDRFVLTLLHRRQIKGEHFLRKENGSYLLTEEGHRIFLENWNERLHEEEVHPFLGEKMPAGLVPFAQARLLSKAIRGEIDGYPPYFSG